MMGVVLALAGLTCGDGGPGAGAATAPAWSAAGRWVGTLHARVPVRVDWDNDRGAVTFEAPGLTPATVEPAHFTPLGGGQVLLEFERFSGMARCEWREGQLRIYDKRSVYVLRPAAPRKP